MSNGVWSFIDYLNEDISNLKKLKEAAEKRLQEVQNWKDIPIDFKDEMEQAWLVVLKEYDDMIGHDLAMKEKLIEQVSTKN